MRTTDHLQYLDGWRGVAVILLLIGHFFPIPGFNFGAIGVDFFFVLSGLLMARLLFVYKVPLPQFYQRRISRIFPAVVFYMLVMLAAMTFLGRPILWDDVLAAATFTNNYLEPVHGAQGMPFGHFWSLSVEEHSYIVLSLIALAARRKITSAPRLLGVSVMFMLACCALYLIMMGQSGGAKWTGLAANGTQTEIAALGLFVSAGFMLYFEGKQLPCLSLPAFLALLAVILCLYWWSVPAPLQLVGKVVLLALAVNLLAGAHPSVQTLLSANWLRQVGIWSFSIYLWQQPFHMLSKFHGWSPVLGLALGLACAMVSFYFIEQPARDWLNKRWNPPQAPVGAAPLPGA